MKLWVTPKGDRWLCEDCEDEFEQAIADEGWRVAFDEKYNALLRCSACKLGDVEIFD